MERVRLNKFLAQCGVCSRRDADRLIEQGRVMVNGCRAGLGTQVTKQDEVLVNGKRLASSNLAGPEESLVLAYYKPVGVVCTEKDKHAERKVTDSIKTSVRVTYAGRLDKDSEGLLLLTNDGNLIDAMMRGSHGHEKEYVVKVQNKITGDFLQKIERGIYLKDLDVTTRPCAARQTGPYTFQLTLTQGLNRQIRRMCQACGYQVRSLKRIRVMNITLGDLKPGEYRELSRQEIGTLRKMCQQNRVKEAEAYAVGKDRAD
ncbi:MAG: pseudouridine synthase [Roseburia sp.]|nr:pseudouridine synthase [Roseburia sp.]